MSMEDRIAELEIALAHQQKVCDDLNEVVTAQTAEIAELKRRMEALVKRFLLVEEAVAPDIPVDRPPHW